MSLLDPRHIRTRLTLYFVSILAVIQLIYSGAACFLMLRDLRSQLVRHAIQDVETVEGLLHFTADGRLWLKDDYHNHPESKLVLERLLEVRSPSGRVLLRNDMLGRRSLGEAMLPNEGVGGYSAREYTLADGMRVQLVSRYHVVDGRPTIIRVAHSQEPLWAQFRSDLVSLVLPLPLVLFLAGLGGYRLASNALQPIQSMARKAEEIRSDRLHERLPVNPADGELAELARVFNSVLGQLERSFEQLRRFTSDASHELRTPLTGIRSVGEVALQRQSTSPESYRDAIGSMLEEANKLTKLVDNLLAIARADAGEIHLNPSTFGVKALVDECTGLLEVLLEENAQTLTVDVPADCRIRADWLLLRQALVNVLHNAIKFTPPGGAIRIEAIERPHEVVISVQDSGPGIPVESLPKIFDRFYRVEKGRSPGAGGTGLGLAITRWTVEMHRGTITAESRPETGAVIRITLPATVEPASPRSEGATEPAERHARV
ncbi:MAG: HAMP domain-containing protein [Bryobacterales bacterium]|nr:HAMP domain-containing protein [Bryobacterales bacterium]